MLLNVRRIGMFKGGKIPDIEWPKNVTLAEKI